MQIPFLMALSLLANQLPLLDVLSWLLDLPGAIVDAYGSSLRWGVDAARDLFEDYGYWVVFFGTLCENTLLLGFIIPGSIVIILAGIEAEAGTISLPLAYVIALAGTIIGDTISYCLGRFGWSRFGHWSMFKDVETKIREPLLAKGSLFVITYHFAGYTRVVGPTAAGFLKMPFAKWAPADYFGASLWILVYMSIGYGLGALGFTLDSSQDYFRYVEWALLALVFLAGWQMYKSYERVAQARRDSASKDEAPVVQQSIL
jgi:membrane protein DedA with SNARE-associated domain